MLKPFKRLCLNCGFVKYHFLGRHTFTKISDAISYMKILFHIWIWILFWIFNECELFEFRIWNENFVREIKFMWMFYFICKMHVSFTTIPHAKFWTSSFHTWFRYFICEIKISCVKMIQFHLIFYLWNDTIVSLKPSLFSGNWTEFNPQESIPKSKACTISPESLIRIALILFEIPCTKYQ